MQSEDLPLFYTAKPHALYCRGDKREIGQQNCGDPGKRKGMVQQRQRRICPKDGADPENAKQAGTDHGADGRIQCMTSAAQDAGRDLVQIADRFKEQNTQNANGSALHHGCFCGKDATEKMAKQNDREDQS